MTQMSDGNVVPNVEKCMNELLQELSKVDEEKVVDILLYYITKKHRFTFMQKLRDRRIVPKVMDEFDYCATLLDKAGRKKWQWRSIQ